MEKQRALFDNYYQELWQVKELISGYEKVKNIIRLQNQIVVTYKKSYNLFRQNNHFTNGELNFIYQVYSGILDESLKNLDQVLLVINGYVTQMGDGPRLDIIETAASALKRNYNDLKEFNNQILMLSLQRSAEGGDLQNIKNLYGLP